MSSGRSLLRFNQFFDTMFPHHEVNFHIISRLPRVIESSNSVLLPFSTILWITIFTSLLALATTLLFTHRVYSTNEVYKAYKLHQEERSKINFFLFTICKITEPDALPWFTRNWSVGRIITGMWALFSLMLILFYNCNLRAYLSALKYEKQVDSIDDVLENGHRPWIMIEMAESR